MLIGIDASRANRPHKTGTEWYAYHLIRELAALGSRHQYILYSDQPLRGGLADLVADKPAADYCPPVRRGWQELLSPAGNFRAKILAWPPQRLWTQLRLSWELLRHKPDLLFVPAHALPVVGGIKNLATIHDIGFRQRPDLYPEASRFNYFEWSTKWAVRHAWRLLTVSEFSRQQLLSAYNLSPDKAVAIANGYDDRSYRPLEAKEVAAVLRRYQLQQPYILSVGRLEKKKNTLTLIQAFVDLKTRHPDWPHQLVLVGAPGYGFAEIEQAIAASGLAEQIRLTGWLPEADLPALFNGAAVFAFPSQYEGFGIPLLEAMACGTPVVAADNSALPEVAAEAALYFAAEQPGQLADRLETVLHQPAAAERLRQAGLERARQFSWRSSAQRLLELINQADNQ